MDVDVMTMEQRTEAMKKGLCFGCGKHGHLNKDCPDKKGKKTKEKKDEKKKWTSKELQTHVRVLFDTICQSSYNYQWKKNNGMASRNQSWEIKDHPWLSMVE